MKKYLLLTILILPIITSAATTISTDITTTGKVGVGSTTPYAKLSIDNTSVATGPELITNGTFTGGTTGWTLGNNVAYGDNNVVSTYVGGDPSLSTTFPTVAGRTYLISYTVSNISTLSLVYFYLDLEDTYEDPASKNGTHTYAYRATNTGTETITFDDWNYWPNDTFTLDNVSVRETSEILPALNIVSYGGETLLNLGSDLLGNLGMGASSLKSNTTGFYNSAYGHKTLSSNTTGGDNSVFGYLALMSNTTGGGNSALGSNVLTTNTTGSYNVGYGYNALFTNTTGNNNVAIGGYGPLIFNITGSNNTAVGYASLWGNLSATNTTAIGYKSGNGSTYYSNQGGTYVGYQSGYSAGNDSDYNTLIGYQSGYGITTGKNNIVLGTATSSTSVNNITTGSQNILIGNNIGLPSSTASGQLNIGNIIYGTGITSTGTTVSSGNIGIGTTSPTTKLHVTSGASATTTVTIGSLGLTTSKGCVNMNRADGGAGSFYINAAGTMITESNYCR